MRSLHSAQHLLALSDQALATALVEASLAYGRSHDRLAETALEAGRTLHHRRHTQEAQRGFAQARALAHPRQTAPIIAAARQHLHAVLQGAPIPDQPLLCLVEPNASNEIVPARLVLDPQPELRR